MNRAKRQRNKTRNIEKHTTTTSLVINNYSNNQSVESLTNSTSSTSFNTSNDNSTPNVPLSNPNSNSTNSNNLNNSRLETAPKKRVIVTEKLSFSNSNSPASSSISNLPIPSVMGLTQEQAKQMSQMDKTSDDADEVSHISEQNSSFDFKELTEDDIEFLMDNTGFNCDQIKRWHVEFLNKCPTGLIKFDQFKAYYKILLPTNLCDESKEEIVLKLFQLFDIDADGCLNFTEFLISFWIRCKAPLREKFTWVFNMLDLDRNGYLSYFEMKHALSLCLNIKTLDTLLEQLNKEVNKEKSSSKPVPIYVNDLSDFSDDEDDFVDENSFSRLTTEEKLQQAIILLNLLSQKNKSKNLQEVQQQEKEFFLNSIILFEDSHQADLNVKSSKSQCRDKCMATMGSNDCDSLKSALNKIQITRENFIDLAEKFKLLRKLVLPIHNFYEDSLGE